jgi:hypothetical protein
MRTLFALVTVGSIVSLCACGGGERPPLQTLPGASVLPTEAKPGGFAIMSPTPDGKIGYSGDITREGFEALTRAADDKRVRTLLVRSEGGEVQTALTFGEWVHERGLDLVVVDYCALMCASYVFPAGREKTILPGAVVAWRGDAHDDFDHIDPLEPPPKWTESITELRAREDVLAATLGVNECISRIGVERLGYRGLGWRFAGKRVRGFYTMSAADMARFGVDHVTAGPNEEDVNPKTREWLDLSFVKIPPSIDLKTACL